MSAPQQTHRILCSDWDLRAAGPLESGPTGTRQRVTRVGVQGAGAAAVLRTYDPSDAEVGADTEHIVLRRWAGAGAVRLLSADPARCALLVEDPAPGVSLVEGDLIEACEQLGALLTRLAVPAPAQLRPLVGVVDGIPDLLHRASDVLPRRMIDEAVGQLRGLSDDSGAGVVTPLDLTFSTVVRATREPVLTTSGRAIAGDPAYAVAAAVWDRPDEAARAYRLRTHLRLRVEVICDVAGIDAARARAFAFVRTAERLARGTIAGGLTPPDVTRGIGVLKAMQG